MEGHRQRVGALAWSSSLLSSGSRDKSILQRDIRTQDDFVSKMTGHKSEVCGLKWSYDNRELASGGNDNRLFVWNQHSTQPVLKYCEHTAAVKAIAWSPHLHGLLASGGGTADKCIRLWNTTTNTHLSCMDTGSQVCNLAWSKCQRTCQHPWVLAKPNRSLEISYNVKVSDTDGSYIQSSLPCYLTGWTDNCHRSRG